MVECWPPVSVALVEYMLLVAGAGKRSLDVSILGFVGIDKVETQLDPCCGAPA